MQLMAAMRKDDVITFRKQLYDSYTYSDFPQIS